MFIINLEYIQLMTNLIITYMLMWGQRIYDPGPLYIKAQGPSREETLPMTHSESPKKA